MNIHIDSAYTDKLPDFKIAVIKAKVKSMPSTDALKGEMTDLFKHLATTAKVEDISKYPEITAGRAAYRAFGKDPTRYRLSAEKLQRRIIKGEGLDFINNIVDLSNLISLKYRCPVGTFDFHKIKGNVVLRAGAPGEVYFSLGSQELNLEGLPIFADAEGPFGSTTSDSARTSVDEDSEVILLTIFGFENQFDFQGAITFASRLIVDYCQGEILFAELLPARKTLQIG